MTFCRFNNRIPRLALADLEGRGHFGQPGRIAEPTPDVDYGADEQRLRRSRALREWLAEVLGEQALHLALRLFVEGLSCRGFAAELGCSPATGWHTIQEFRRWLSAAIRAALTATPPTDAWVRNLLYTVARPDSRSSQ